MAQYIDKDALVAELKKRIRDYWNNSENTMGIYPYALEEVVKYVDTLEVKEVDLEKEIGKYLDANDIEFGHQIKLLDFAKHFFELGLKAQKDNIWHTVDETPNYPCDILFLTNVDNMFLYRYMENGRPVDRETPYFNTILNGKCWCYCNDIVNK